MVRVAQPTPAQLTTLRSGREGDRGVHRGDHLVGVGDVAVRVDAADLGRDLRAAVVVEVRDDDLDAARGQGEGRGLAEPRGAPGDDGGGVVEVHECSRPLEG